MNTAIATRQANPLASYAPDAIQSTMQMAQALVASRLTPRGVDTPEKAFYIIMKGRELGVPPIRALERIHIIEGKTCMAAELMLERFRQRGGHSKWVQNTALIAEIWLKAPNGDEHTEVFSMDEAKAAGVASKDNWRKWPKAMLRARAATAALRAMGEAEGLYDPDELGAVTNEDGEVVTSPKDLGGYSPPSSILASANTAEPSDAVAVESIEHHAATVYEPASDEILLADDSETLEEVPVYENKGSKQKPDWQEVGRSEKRSLAQNKEIHALRGELKNKFSDVQYRKHLQVNYNKNSSAELSKDEAMDHITRMRDFRAKQWAAYEKRGEPTNV